MVYINIFSNCGLDINKLEYNGDFLLFHFGSNFENVINENIFHFGTPLHTAVYNLYFRYTNI